MLVITTYLPPLTLMAHGVTIASNDTVGELVSDFVVNSLCDPPFAHPRAMMLLPRFSFRNISYQRAFFVCSCDRSSFLSSSSASRSSSWFSSSSNASFTLSPNLLMPSLMLIWFINMCVCGFASLLAYLIVAPRASVRTFHLF